MAKLSFPTDRQVAPPLLIDSNQLETLDRIVDRHMAVLREYREREIEVATESEIQRRVARGTLREEQIEARRAYVSTFAIAKLQKDSRSATLYLKGGKEVQAERFSDAMNQPVGEQELPTGMGLYITVGAVRAMVRVSDERWRRELIVEVEPNDVGVAQELFGALSNWASDVEAPRWQQKWVSIRGVLAGMLILCLFVGLLFTPFLNWTLAARRANQVEARKLLAQGITPSNQQRALELLLAIESNYDYGRHVSILGIRYWSYFAIGALGLTTTVICPQICIGLWKGKKRLKWWRRWITTITVTIPLLLLSSLILPWFLHWLGISPPSQ
jgi:hypothetical protein